MHASFAVDTHTRAPFRSIYFAPSSSRSRSRLAVAASARSKRGGMAARWCTPAYTCRSADLTSSRATAARPASRGVGAGDAGDGSGGQRQEIEPAGEREIEGGRAEERQPVELGVDPARQQRLAVGADAGARRGRRRPRDLAAVDANLAAAAPATSSAPNSARARAALARRRRLDDRAQKRARQTDRRAGAAPARRAPAHRGPARGGQRRRKVAPVVELGDGQRHDRAGATQPLDERAIRSPASARATSASKIAASAHGIVRASSSATSPPSSMPIGRALDRRAQLRVDLVALLGDRRPFAVDDRRAGERQRHAHLRRRRHEREREQAARQRLGLAAVRGVHEAALSLGERDALFTGAARAPRWRRRRRAPVDGARSARPEPAPRRVRGSDRPRRAEAARSSRGSSRRSRCTCIVRRRSDSCTRSIVRELLRGGQLHANEIGQLDQPPPRRDLIDLGVIAGSFSTMSPSSSRSAIMSG